MYLSVDGLKSLENTSFLALFSALIFRAEKRKVYVSVEKVYLLVDNDLLTFLYFQGFLAMLIKIKVYVSVESPKYGMKKVVQTVDFTGFTAKI